MPSSHRVGPPWEQSLGLALEQLDKAAAEIERLRADKQYILETIANWANDEGISFDASGRLSKLLGL